MNRIILFLLITFLAKQASGQEISLYGFYNDGTPSGDYLKLAQVDPLTGELAGIDSIFSIKAYALGSSTFDQVNRNYSFVGVDTGYAKRLVSWSLAGDSIVDLPAFTETINDIQYDMNTMVFYGMGNYIVDTLVWDTAMNFYLFDYASRLVTIDPQNGEVNEINKLPDLRAFPAGGSTFDANNGRYIVNGKDPDFKDRLFIIDAATGDILSSSSLDQQAGEYLNELEYNNVNDKLYGFFRDNNAGTKAIVSVDLQTTAVEVIADLSQVWAFIQGASVFHQESQVFILYYIDYFNNSKLVTVDITTGEIVSDVFLDGNITELEIDNNEFAMAAYHSTTDLQETIQSDAMTLYPNPARERFAIRTASPIHTITVLDMKGRAVWEQTIAGSDRAEVDCHGFFPGMYIVRVETTDGIVLEKISIR